MPLVSRYRGFSGNFDRDLLVRMTIEIPGIRPAVLNQQSFLFLDKVRAFRHFIRHAYDCEFAEDQLVIIQTKLKAEFHYVEDDLRNFRDYIQQLSITTYDESSR